MNKKNKVFIAIMTFSVFSLFVLFCMVRFEDTKAIEKTEKIDIKLNYEKIYLAIDEEKKVESNVLAKWKSENVEIATVKDGVIKGLNVGTTKIIAYIGESNNEVEVVVTDLISLPEINDKKEYLKCNQYTSEEAKLLDEILEYRINEAGLKTRAGVVAAARFLSLEFKYKINYFLENGRLITTGGRTVCDGEGRYSHKGLYLDDSKKSILSASVRGPAIWGCPLYSGVNHKTLDNGLDCSGFVTWALINGGYPDTPDGGAGITSSTTDNDDLGDKIPIKTAMKNSSYKVGDLMSRYGHIGIIIGMDDKNVYIAEAYDNDLHVLIMKKNELNTKWSYVVNMDSYYESDGNITEMWN